MREATAKAPGISNLRALDLDWFYGMRHLTTGKKQVVKVDDLKGMKIRSTAPPRRAVAATARTIATGSGGDIGRNVSISGNPGYNPVGPLTAPGVPATTVAYTNPFGVACAVFITGGTVTAVAIGGTSTGLTSGMFRVPAGQTIKLTYSSAPTWTWFGD